MASSGPKRRGNHRRDARLAAAMPAAARRRAAGRRLAGVLMLLVGIPALAAGAYWGGRKAWRAMFSENDFFLIRRIEVTTDGSLGADHIREYARVREGMNLFGIRPGEARAMLLSVPVIAQAQVGRRLPDTVVIEVAERTAVARLGRPGSGTPLAVDNTGHVLGPSSVRASLPVILGVRDKGLRPGDVVQDPLLPTALSVLEICNHATIREELGVETIDVGPADFLEVGLTTGERVLLSHDQVREKLDRLHAMRREARKRGLNLAVYDMTVDRNFVGRPAAGAGPVEEN
ncbi:MAG: FtsQ-type POTRA domain-containing protein [Kiritimatiellae bacterium]|nr:FtsQ-type POTRA domain-containing protein [Kiritimatiellia bacterium]